MSEGLTKYFKTERAVTEAVSTKEVKQKKRDEEIVRLKNLNEMGVLTEELLAKHSDVLKLQKYTDYLKDEVRSMPNQTVKGSHIILKDTGFQSPGHKAERFVLGYPVIRKKQNIPVLRLGYKNLDYKDLIFEDLVDYYGSDLFQKVNGVKKGGEDSSECLLAKFAGQTIVSFLRKADINVKSYRFVSLVGTPVDFNFGVDAFIEIEDDDGQKIRVYLDMTINDHKTNSSGFSDVNLKIKTKNKEGDVDLESRENVLGVVESIQGSIDVYKNKSKRNKK